MAKAKTPAATRKPREKNPKEQGPKPRNAERPPESAEDFAHVLRRFASVRKERPGED